MQGDIPARIGLYDARFEHDACGVGFVADIEGRPAHDIVQQAVHALTRLSHRGAVSADGMSGDGAGVMTQVPHGLFGPWLAGQGVHAAGNGYGVGVVFLPRESQPRQQCREICHEQLSRTGLAAAAWRTVPIDLDALGGTARASCPCIEQMFVVRRDGLDEETFERRLYLARKRIEHAVRAAQVLGFHVASMSSRTVVYKGLMAAPQLGAFYADLSNPAYESAIGLFHQRYSTNTFARWALAQPFRFLGHNGEINTLRGNINRFRATLPKLASDVWGEEIGDLLPILDNTGSDSAVLDNIFELLTLSGRDPLHAMMMLIPPPYQQMHEMEPQVVAFFEYHSALISPWDGPAAVAFTDGRMAAATLDRNGLRPMRYWVTTDGRVIAGSETGIIPEAMGKVAESGRLGPGMMIAVDTDHGRVMRDEEIKRLYARRRPYVSWVTRQMIRAGSLPVEDDAQKAAASVPDLTRVQKAFAYGAEDIDRILIPMMYEGKEPVGSMGDDTPLAVLSQNPKTIYRYFKQAFAQVTNPPIDSLRERLVMSLRTALGGRSNVLDESEEAAALIKLESPIAGTADFDWLMNLEDSRFRRRTLSCLFRVADGPEGLEAALARLCADAEAAIDDGCTILVLSDRGVDAEHAPIPMLLATAGVHHHLIRAGKRTQASLVCDTGDPRMEHHFACLIGYGAALVHPYVALATVGQYTLLDPRGAGIGYARAAANYRQAVEKGILKILAKMGISTVGSYRGAQVFEAIGVSSEVIERHFTGTICRVGGVGLKELATDVLRFHGEAFGENAELADRGIYHYRKHGEYHATNPTITKLLHKAVRERDRESFEKYTQLVDGRAPCNLRDLLEWKKSDQPVPLEEVEPAEEIARRFCTQAMSHGAISREAHEVLAVAMNRIGAKSNSGEGGEQSERFYRYEDGTLGKRLSIWQPQPGDWGNSAIKQVASARFGVTPEYLVSAAELEIKMAQGSKPGEGGQILGDKVTEEIAGLRRSAPGISLISPPPHHDIYSIEDLGQLIYDLKRINPRANIGVKLVSASGVGTIAAGVAKAYADCIQISGYDGGTGASPLSSIKHVGLPWELGLAEAQQVLVLNDLRGRVRLRVDGGMKTGRDVVIAALLGADEFGFGTAALVAAGCVMVRQCHLNNCPVGIATQREDLRRKFPGQPEHVVALMLFVAEQTRMALSQMGFRRLDEVIGRVDLLLPAKNAPLPKASNVDVSAMFVDVDPGRSKPRLHTPDAGVPQSEHCDPTPEGGGRPVEAEPLDELVWRDCAEAVEAGKVVMRSYMIGNQDRTVGARLSGEIARRTRGEGLPAGSVRLVFRGCAGQSFGAFCNRGMTLILEGEAQDYVGKSMYGGEIAIRPNPALGNRIDAEPPVVMGNTVMYGATGGGLYAAGRTGERACVRNSGGWAVFEGCGMHGCEYMTGGVVLILGETGRNFGAGMTGGVAYLLDADGRAWSRCHPEFVELKPLDEYLDASLVLAMLRRHLTLTGSSLAAWMLEQGSRGLSQIAVVSPRCNSAAWADAIVAMKRNALEQFEHLNRLSQAC